MTNETTKNETTARAIWRQPLLHFLVAGLAIFLLNGLRGDEETAPGDNNITVTVAQVERMAALWTRTWGRAPSERELQGLVRDHIKEEIYYREALKLGLDVNDTVIRRRLRQKMELLSEGDAALSEPDEEALRAYFAENADRYRQGETFAFRQVYFSDADSERMRAALDALADGAAPGGLGDAIGLPAEMTDADAKAVARVFGSAFLDEIKDLPTGSWVGPVPSSFGRHLVFVSTRNARTPAALADIRKRVVADWRSDETARMRGAAFDALRAEYDIEIEQPE
ncbi:MAG: peptidylprolyl isomerase [Pseudomonadota bacterium]